MKASARDVACVRAALHMLHPTTARIVGFCYFPDLARCVCSASTPAGGFFEGNILYFALPHEVANSGKYSFSNALKIETITQVRKGEIYPTKRSPMDVPFKQWTQ